MRERRFIAGSVLAGVVDLLAERIDAGQWDLSSLVVVTPGARAGRVLISMLADRAADLRVALSPPATITPSELAGSVLVLLEQRHGPIGAGWRSRPPAPALTRRALWIRALRAQDERTLSQITPHMVARDDARAWSSLADVLSRSASDLSAAGLRLRDAARRSREAPGFEGEARLEAAARVQDAYEQLLERHGLADPTIDAVDAVDRLAARLREVDKSEPVVELMLVGVVELTRVARNACLLPGVGTTAIIAGPESWSDRFDALGCFTHVDDASAADWAHAGGVPWIGDADVWIGEDPRDQARKAMAAIALVAERSGIAPHEVTLGVPDASVAFHLEREARRAGATVRAGLMVEVAHTEPYRLCEAILSHARDRTLLSLRGALLRPKLEDWVVRRVKANVGEGPHGVRGVLARGVLCAIDDYAESSVHSSLEQDFTTRDQALAWVLRSIREALDSLAGPIAACTTARQAAMCLLRALGEVYRGVEIDTTGSPGKRREVDAARHIASSLREAASEAAEAFDEGDEEAPDAITAVESALLVIGETPLAEDPEPDAIEGLGWLEVLLDPAPCVVLTGMNAGLVPTRSTPDPLIPEALRRVLGLEHAGARARRDAALFASMLACKEQVRVVLGRRDEDGSALMPSPVLLSRDGRSLADLMDRFTRDQLPDLASQRVHAITAGRKPAGRGVRASVASRPWIDAPLPARLSVTALRDYLASPYVFYLRHVLGVGEVDEPATRLEPSTMGSLLHRTLEVIDGEGRDLTDPAALEALLLDELARQVARGVAVASESRGPAGTLVRLQIESARQRLHAVAHAQAKARQEGWRSIASERMLSGGLIIATEPDLPPFPILRGKIDRIDVHEGTGAIRVIDYKTGDTAHDPESTHLHGEEWVDLQLPLYRHIASAMVDKRDYATLGDAGDEREIQLSYFTVSSDPSEVCIRVADWDATTLASADEVAREVMRGIVRGEWFDVGSHEDPETALGAMTAWASREIERGTMGGGIRP